MGGLCCVVAQSAICREDRSGRGSPLHASAALGKLLPQAPASSIVFSLADAATDQSASVIDMRRTLFLNARGIQPINNRRLQWEFGMYCDRCPGQSPCTGWCHGGALPGLHSSAESRCSIHRLHSSRLPRLRWSDSRW